MNLKKSFEAVNLERMEFAELYDMIYTFSFFHYLFFVESEREIGPLAITAVD